MNEKLPSEEQIQVRAYEIYLNRGCEGGHALEDWLAAETELMAQGEALQRSPKRPLGPGKPDAMSPRQAVQK